MANFVSNILLRFKGDSRDAVGSLNKLDRAQKKTANQTVAMQKRAGDAYGRTTAAIGKVTIGLAAAGGAYVALARSAEAYARRQQLVAASAGANIDSIQGAAQGLITQTQALEFAAAAQNTEFKLTQQQMETVAKAMVSLRNQGNDFTEVQRRLTQAVVEGNSRALRPFGVIVEGSTGKLETHKAVMAALAVEAGKLEEGVELAGDAFLRTQVKIRDWKDEVVAGMGAATNATLSFVADASHALEELFDLAHTGTRSQLKDRQEKLAEAERGLQQALEVLDGRREKGFLKTERFYREQVKSLGRSIEKWKTQIAELEGVLQQRESVSLGLVERLAIQRQQAVRDELGLVEQLAEGYDHLLVREGKATRPRKPRPRAPSPDDDGLKPEQRERIAEFMAVSESLPTIPGLGDGAIEAAADSMGEAFVRLGETHAKTFDELLERNEKFRMGFELTTAAAQSAFQAWASGSMTAGEALKAFTGQMLGQIASRMWAKGLEEFAMGLASLIVAPQAAATHFSAAAAFSAGAIAVGGVARKYGGRQTRTSANRGSAGRSVAPEGARGQGQPSSAQGASQTFVVVTNPFDDNPREARRRLARAFDRAREERGGTGTAVIRA